MYTGTPQEYRHTDHHTDRRASIQSEASVSTNASTSSDASEGQSLSDHDAAFLLLSIMGHPSSPFTTPSSETRSLKEDSCVSDVLDDIDDVDADELEAALDSVKEPVPERIIEYAVEDGIVTSSEEDIEPIAWSTVAEPVKTKAGATLKANPKLKVKLLKKTNKSKAKKIRSASPADEDCEALEHDISDLCEADKAEVLLRPMRDRRKCAQMIRHRNDPENFEPSTITCDRCLASGWECYKRKPVMINNKPGPAPGHGRGCVTCHKSACSLVGKSKKPNTNKKTIKPQKTIKAVAQQSAQ